MDNLPETQNLPKEKKIPSGLVLLVLIIIVFCFAVYYLIEEQKNQKLTNIPGLPTANSPSTPNPTIKQLSVDKLPPLFPRDILLEKEAEVLQNYSQIVGNKEQDTRQFVSQKSLSNNFQIYKKYLTDKKWTIISIIDKPELKSLSAKRGLVFLSITLIINKKTTQNIVYITVVGPKITNL